MTDTIILGAGNSRTLRTVPNALTLYDTHEKMLAAMIRGEFPIDLGPINQAGCEVVGNNLNKETMLTDKTAELYPELPENPVPDNVFAAIRPLIQRAQETADTVRSIRGSYVGTTIGSFDPPSATKRTTTLIAGWKAFIVEGFDRAGHSVESCGICVRGSSVLIVPYNTPTYVSVSETNNSISIPDNWFNRTGESYYYAAIG